MWVLNRKGEKHSTGDQAAVPPAPSSGTGQASKSGTTKLQSNLFRRIPFSVLLKVTEHSQENPQGFHCHSPSKDSQNKQGHFHPKPKETEHEHPFLTHKLTVLSEQIVPIIY